MSCRLSRTISLLFVWKIRWWQSESRHLQGFNGFCGAVQGQDQVQRQPSVVCHAVSQCKSLNQIPQIFLTIVMHTHPHSCPICGLTDSLTCAEELGEDGFFYICNGNGGCGTSFIVTHDGECQDFY